MVGNLQYAVGNADFLADARMISPCRDERILDALPTKQRDQFVDDLLSIVDTLQKLSASAGQK